LKEKLENMGRQESQDAISQKIDLRLMVKKTGAEPLVKTLLRPLVRKFKTIWKSNNPFANVIAYSEIDPLFIEYFLKISHPYGITLSVDEIGSSCQIAQNTTIGTNGKFQRFDEGTKGFKPRLGHLVKTNAGVVISGPIRIGNCVIISAGTIVTKDVPNFSIVKGVNEIQALSEHHFNTFLHILHQQLICRNLPVEGAVWKNGLCFKSDAITKVNSLFKSKYPDIGKGFIKILKDHLS
jgi:serine acetyltransferase